MVGTSLVQLIHKKSLAHPSGGFIISVGLFFGVVLADVFPEIVVLVAFGAVADSLLHPLIDTVDVVKQTFLRFFSGIRTLVDDVDDVLDLLTTLPDGIVQRLPFSYLTLFGRKLAARDQDD